MLKNRLIPLMLLQESRAVITTRYSGSQYTGDPVNTVRMFNEFEVDEIIVVDVGAARSAGNPDFDMVRRIAQQCFMPLTYGGGIAHLDSAKRLLELGVEKFIVNRALREDPQLVERLSGFLGAQALVASLDVIGGVCAAYDTKHPIAHEASPARLAKFAIGLGCGEVLVTDVARQGSFSGPNVSVIHEVCTAVDVPVIANGGIATIQHAFLAFAAGATGAARGTASALIAPGQGVLVNFPTGIEVAR